MSYRPGMDVRTAHVLGMEAGDPRIICDGCGLVNRVSRPHGVPFAWFMNGKAPPGWRLLRNGDVRRDFCPRCKESNSVAVTEPKEGGRG